MRCLLRWLCLVSGVMLLGMTPILIMARLGHQNSAAWIAFSTLEGRGQALYRVLPDGRNLQRLSSSIGNFRHPTWSPDGQEIAFVADLNDTTDIYRMPSAGAPAEQVTHDYGNNIYPLWSPDGAWILFMYESPRALYRIHPDGTDMRHLSQIEALLSLPVWSQDGQWIGFENQDILTGQSDIYKMRADGSSRTVMVSRQDQPGMNIFPVWSPDGKWLAFVSNATIYRMATLGGLVEAIVQPLTASGPAYLGWSPDGKWITFVTRGSIYPDYRLYRVPAAGGEVEDITQISTGHYAAPQWSPDGEWLLFAGEVPSNRNPAPSRKVELWNIYKIHPDGTGRQLIITAAGPNPTPIWSPAINRTWQPLLLLLGGVLSLGFQRKLGLA
ncbi:MAG: TolB family protein [Chloroflexi bacterium]|nr:TolB family protein [Chloroflexota bacterium]